MSQTSTPANPVWNIPNQLSAARVVMAVGCFVALSLEAYGVGLALFLLATLTDWLDGYWARRFKQITKLGRILDPFADKLLVCGVFIYLAAIPKSNVAPWMAVVVMGREMLVTALRSFIERSGGDFSAKWAGKWKMALQCAAVIGAFLLMMAQQPSDALNTAHLVVLYAAIALTIYSGWGYLRLAGAKILE